MMMKQKTNAVIKIVLCVATLWVGMTFSEDEEDDILIDPSVLDPNYVGEPPPVVRVPRIKPSEEELFRGEKMKMLPYSWNGVTWSDRLRTLGQLSKTCDYVVVGKVAAVKSAPSKKPPSFDVLIELDVEDVLFGDIPFRWFLPSKRISITGHWPKDGNYDMLVERRDIIPHRDWNKKKRPKRGDKLLMFLFNTPDILIEDDAGSWNVFRFDFKKKETARQAMYNLAIGNWGSGVRCLDTPENTTNYVSAAKGYLTELRGKERDAESYYSLLRHLVLSPIPSIREDARSDLMYFIQYWPAFDLQRLLSDTNIDEAIKYWVEHDIIPKREAQEMK